MKNNKGQSMIELTVMMPFVAVFILIIIQFAKLFTETIHDLEIANAKTWKMQNDWEVANIGKGFTRPCIEKMGEHSFEYSGDPVAIGMGKWKREISVPQEVQIVSTQICITR